MSRRISLLIAICGLVCSPVVIAGPAECSYAGWDIQITASVDVATGYITFTFCRTGATGGGVCGLSHFSIPWPLEQEGGEAVACATLEDSSDPAWVVGKDPSAEECHGDIIVLKYDKETPRDGNTYCDWVTLSGVYIGCGDYVLKGGTAGCDSFWSEVMPTCEEDENCDDPPEDPCDPEAQGWTLTQGAWGSAKHYEALACDIITACPTVAADIETVAVQYGFQPGVDDLGTWVTGDCGAPGAAADGGFVPSGFNPGENGGSQLIAALLNIDGVACYGLDQLGNPVDAVGRDWIVLSTGQTVGEVLDLAMLTFGDGYAGILGEINESWDEGLDYGLVSPCPREP